MTDRTEREKALIYCPQCGHDFHSTELAQARNNIRSLADLRDAQAEQIRMLASKGFLNAH